VTQLVLNGLIAGSLGALIAGGLALAYGYMGAYNFALGQFALFGGYITWWLHMQHGWPLTASIPAALLFVALLSYCSYMIAVRPFVRFHRYLPLLSTIALSMVLDALILLLFKESPKGIIRDKHAVDLGNFVLNYEQVILVIVTILCLCGIAFLLHKTRLGRQIYACVQHPQAAQSIGISSNALILLLFIGSGVLAALGGIFIGIDQVLTPTLGFSITIKAYAAVIAGGRHHFAGPILCAYIIAFCEQFAVGIPWFGGHYIPAGFQAAVSLLVIIAFLLAKPSGLFGARLRTV
jgi:branched-subunit amino acid ABC-type transport system permease component